MQARDRKRWERETGREDEKIRVFRERVEIQARREGGSPIRPKVSPKLVVCLGVL